MNDKIAIVTGASSGIGAAVAHKFVKEGIKVVLVSRSEAKLKKVADEIEGETMIIPTDVSHPSSVQKLYKEVINQYGKVDVLVNNAGVMLNAAITEGQVADWEQMIDVNVKGTLYGINQVVPDMIKREQGHIVNTASVSAFEVSKKSAVYSATKFAIRAIAMGLEKELAHTGVRVTNVSPGMVDTPLASRAQMNRKPLDPKNIADAVYYAISQPSHVNVNEITVRPV